MGVLRALAFGQTTRLSRSGDSPILKTEILAPGVLKIVAPETLHADDFLALGPQVDAIIKDYGEIRLLIDATHLEGWDSLTTPEKHAAFVKANHAKVTRIASSPGATGSIGWWAP